MENKNRPPMRHSVLMDRREVVNVTGVTDCLSFDEESVVAETELGLVIIRGAGLAVKKVNLESGEMSVTGSIDGVNYEETHSRGKGLFSKIFK